MGNQARIGESCASCTGSSRSNGFDFNDNSILHNEVHPITAVELHALVLDRQVNLPPTGNSAQIQPVAEALLQGSFRSRRSELLMWVAARPRPR